MLNWSRVEELRGEVGDEAFAEVVDLFLEEVAEVIEALGNPPGAMEEQLHFLKGAALNLGFDEFSRLCSAGERAARQGRGAEVDVAAVRESYATTCAVFMARVEQAGYLAA